jgi:hypothetical protein
MNGVVFITRTGYDPEKGKHVKDPYLGPTPTLGACRPDIRRRVVPGDYIFVVSGKVHMSVPQFVIGGFAVDEKLDALAAFERFPERRLSTRSDGQLDGNVVVEAKGNQHPLDTHKTETFAARVQNYIVGKDPVVLTAPHEIERGRRETLSALKSILRKPGHSPIEVLGRGGSWLNESQVLELRDWLYSIKTGR